jgi:uncharacterized membrane protein
MEWLWLVAVILAFPVIAIVALVKALGNARDLRQVEQALVRIQRELTALTVRIDQLRSSAEAPQGQAAPVRPAAPVAAEPAKPAGAATPEPSPTPKIAKPRQPSPARGLEENLTSRWFVWLGAIAVALAGTFLVKYSIDEGYLGPAARCVLGFLLGAVLAVGGEWLRRRPLQQAIAAVRPDYVPPALTASGLFIAFTSLYAAYALYHLMGPLAALLALATVALLAVALSLLEGMFVALLGVLGGFLTPALIVTPNPNAWGLFAYLTVIAAAALVVARFKGWWWLALAALAGSAAWPLLWMSGAWHAGDEYPVGLYLVLSAVGFFLVRRGWESPDSGQSWLDSIRTLHQPDRVVWIAGAVIAALALFAVDTAHYSVPSLVLFGAITVLYLVAGRREAIFDGLPVLVALASAIVVLAMPLPWTVKLIAEPHAPLVPPALSAYVTTAAALGALFAVGGFVALWGARRPAIWTGVSAGLPVAILAIAYWRIVDLHVDFGWALVAFGLAAAGLLEAERVARHRDVPGMADALGLYAAGVIAFLSLALTMSLREAWLTVALSLQLPLLALVHNRIAVKPVQLLAALVAATVLVRLVLNYSVLGYPVSPTPLLNWVLYGYGLPAASFAGAAWLFRKSTRGLLVTLLDAGALVFGVLLVSLEIRLLVTGSLAKPEYRLPEQSLQALSWLAIGVVLALRNLRAPNVVSYVGSRLLVVLAAVQVFLIQLLAANPFITHEFIGNWPVIDLLMLAYALPAAFAFAWSVIFQRANEAMPARIAAVAGFVLLFADITMEVSHAFQGPVLGLVPQSAAESYAYSIVWLVFAVALLALGIVAREAILRYASLAILVIVALKVFLLDMGGLTGLYRVGSFLGLGLSLVGIGLVYQRFVFPAPPRTVE